MDRFTRFSLKNGAAIVIVALLVTFGGLWSASQLKKETMPDVAIPVVVVVTPYPGAGPADVYENLTEPIESAMRGVAGVKRVSAQSGDSYSAVVAEFSFSEDMEKAEQKVNKALDGVKLPDNALEPNVSRIGFNSAPIMKLAVIGNGTDTEGLRAQVRDEVIPALGGVDGVGEAKLAADAPYAIRIELDTDKLKKKDLTAESVIQQLQAANLSFPVGAVDLGKSTEPIRVGGTIESVDDIKDFRVAVYPNQGKMMASAFGQIGKGMAGLGQGMGALAQGMGQGFSAVGQGMGAMGQGMGQLGSATGEIGMQVGLVNGIQRVQAELYQTKYEVLPALKAAASSVPSGTPEYAELQEQISALENRAIPGMQAAITNMQKQIAASQKQLLADAKNAPKAPAGGISMPAGGGGLSMPSGGSSLSLKSGSSSKSMSAKISTVRLADVAKVTYAPADGSVGTRANSKPAALIDIVKTQDANTVDVSEGVTKEMERLEKKLPAGTKVINAYDASHGINASVEGMMREGLLGALFAVIVILVFLRNWRATLIAAVSIPLSVLIALVMVKQTGVTLNVMTLGGLTVAIGRVVDDSIVVIENIFRHMQRGDERGPQLIRAATAEVSSAITSSTLTTVAVFLPLGMVTGIIGKIFLPFAITVAVSLLASLLVAVTVVPLLARWMLLKARLPKHQETTRSTQWYRSVLTWALDHRAAVVVGALVLFVASLSLMPIIGTGFVPETKEKYVNVKVTYPEGTKSTEVDKTVREVEKNLAAESDVEFYSTTVGGANEMGMGGGTGGTNNSITFVKLKSSADTQGLVAKLRKKSAQLETDDIQVAYEPVNAAGTNSSLEVIVTGPDNKTIRAASDIVERKLERMDGLENVSSNLGTSRPQLTVNVDQGKAAKYGLNAAMIAGTVRGFVAEQEAGSVKLDGKPTDVLYTLKLDDVDRAEEMKRLELSTPLGKTIRLSQIASVVETGSPVAVLTRDGMEYAGITARITERDSGSVINAVRSELEDTKLPAGADFEISGAAEQMNESFSQLGIAMLIAVGAVFLVMIIAFGEATAPLAILFSLPLAVVGGLIGLLVAGVPLDIPAMIGALMLIGIVVTNAIVLVDRVQQKRRQGIDRREALLEAGATRMRPILMTAIATVMALAPLASGFAEGAIISQSLAVIVIGGLTTSTLLTLVVVPVAYDLLEGAKERLFGLTAVKLAEHAEEPTEQLEPAPEAV